MTRQDANSSSAVALPQPAPATAPALAEPAALEGAVVRRPLPPGPWMVAGAMEAGAFAALAMQPGASSAMAFSVAALLHLASALSFLRPSPLAPSERGLAAALALTLPCVGMPLAALALGTVGRSELAQPPPGEGASTSQALDPEEVRRMAEALPCCEALLAGAVEERRAILATLTRRADADALALLRWALGAPDSELAIEAALALEDVSATFESRLEAARREARERPTFEAALAAAEIATRAIDAGIPDPSLVPSLARDARELYAQAGGLDPARYDQVALARARLELAVLRPDSALACIDQALAAGSGARRDELLALRGEAVLAAHALPWEGPSALATYRPMGPPPLTSRRHLLTGGRGGGGRRTLIEDRLTPASRRAMVIPGGEADGERS